MRQTIKIVLLSSALLLPLGSTIFDIDSGAAFAQGNGNSGGHGRGNGGGNSGGGGNGRNDRAANHGSVASELKGLNAAHANEQAFLNAARNSQVGGIAAYREATTSAQTLLTSLTSQGISPDDFDPSTLPTSEQIADYLAILDSSSATYDPASATALLESFGYTDFAALDPAAPDYQSQYDSLLTRLSTETESRLTVNQQLVDYFDASGQETALLDELMPEGGLSDAAMAEFRQLLGL